MYAGRRSPFAQCTSRTSKPRASFKFKYSENLPFESQDCAYAVAREVPNVNGREIEFFAPLALCHRDWSPAGWNATTCAGANSREQHGIAEPQEARATSIKCRADRRRAGRSSRGRISASRNPVGFVKGFPAHSGAVRGNARDKGRADSCSTRTSEKAG